MRLLNDSSETAFTTHVLNWAFGRFELTPFPLLDNKDDLRGVALELTVMGERNEVLKQARKFANQLQAEIT